MAVAMRMVRSVVKWTPSGMGSADISITGDCEDCEDIRRAQYEGIQALSVQCYMSSSGENDPGKLHSDLVSMFQCVTGLFV